MINLRFVNVVWGTAYTDTFLKICLPSMLTPGNLEYVGKNSDSSYKIYTTAKDAETIQKSKVFRRLSGLMDVKIALLGGELVEDDPNEELTSTIKYPNMAKCHTHFINTAEDNGAPFVFLSPDLVWADGSIGNLLQIAQSGKRLVMMTGLRLAKENFISEFLKQYNKNGQIQPITARELVKLALENLHPETQSLEWEAEKSNRWPTLLLWKVKHEGLLLRAFHLHPLMVNPIRRDIFPTVSIDDDYINQVCPDPNDEYVVQDSDQIVAFELSRASARSEFIQLYSQTSNNVAQWAKTDTNIHGTNIGEWAKTNTNAKHRQFLNYKIRIHCNDPSENWTEVEKKSDDVVKEIQSLL